MKHFKDASGAVFAFEEDGSQDDFIPKDLVPISDDEADHLRRPLLSKNQVWELIKAERDRRTEQGGYKVGTKWFHSDQKSRGQQLGLVLLGANIPANLQWKTMDGSFVTMTQTLVQQILAAGAASDQVIFAAAETHRQAMESSADPAAYDFSTGWPKVFGE